ncbi:restriction endonuclease subunit S [Nocardia brasiliensis]|uniref:restriction endonuclease subunit S n=1 Tax=Nocardia brasiliensis TaxID=37326 RepID=UPI0037BC73FD
MNIEVPLPDLDEQRRVANTLDALLRRFDTVRQLQLRSSEIFSALAESLIDSAISTVAELQQVDEIMRLVRKPIDIDAASRYRVIGARSFGKGVIFYPPTRGDELSKLSYFQLPSDALLLSNIKAWEGAISVTTKEIANDFVASNRFLSYLPVDDRVNTSYLRHYFLSQRGLAQISAASPGGADRNRTLGRQRFEALTIPLPPRAEQDRIAAILDGLADRLERARANPAVEALRPAILNAAFTGQL